MACPGKLVSLAVAIWFANTTVAEIADASAIDQCTELGVQKQLLVSSDTDWEWQLVNRSCAGLHSENFESFVLYTLLFPGSPLIDSDKLVDTITTRIPFAQVVAYPPTSVSSAFELSLSVPSNEASKFLGTVEKIAIDAYSSSEPRRKWFMIPSERSSSSYAISARLAKISRDNGLPKIALCYMMVQLAILAIVPFTKGKGTKMWLAVTAVCNLIFVMQFALTIMVESNLDLDRSISDRTLLLLGVMIGLDKPFAITRAVFGRASQMCQPGNGRVCAYQSAIQPSGRDLVWSAMRVDGFKVLWNYCFEALVVLCGAALGSDRGFQQFGVLCAWSLFLDGILLFTSYVGMLATAVECSGISEAGRLTRTLPKGQRDRQLPDFGVLAQKGMLLAGVSLLDMFDPCALQVRCDTITAIDPSYLSGLLERSFQSVGSVLFSLARTRRVPTLVTVLQPVTFHLVHAPVLSLSRIGIVTSRDFRNGKHSQRLYSRIFVCSVLIFLSGSIWLNGRLICALWTWNRKEQSLPPMDMETRAVDAQQNGGTEAACALEKSATDLQDTELVELVLSGKIASHALEKILEDATRAVRIRRAVVAQVCKQQTVGLLDTADLPYRHFDYDRALGACCENIIGYLPLPLGVAGPLLVDGQLCFVPIATTEGGLVASINRGCKAINQAGGVTTLLHADGMTRAPCVEFPSLARAGLAKAWLNSEVGRKAMARAFNSTSRFARLQSMKIGISGCTLFIRFKSTTGDAMGMNMITKGVERALTFMKDEAGFNDMAVVSISGNFCTDKKAAAINWIDGRGKSVVAEAVLPASVIQRVLKTGVDRMVALNTNKNMLGSAMAGSIGGFNTHAANIVTAIFIATGQDPAQVVEGSNCITVLKNLNGRLYASVSMPSLEVGTVGGGTILGPQAASLNLLGVKGAHPTKPGENARRLARVVAAATLAGELSVCSALAEGHLVQAHMMHNRNVGNKVPSNGTTEPQYMVRS